MSLASIGFACTLAGAAVITLYTKANGFLRHYGATAVFLWGWLIGAFGMALTGPGWGLLGLAGPHYHAPGLQSAGIMTVFGGGLLYLYAARFVGRLRSRRSYTLALQTADIYRYVRHPQALALCMMAAGVALLTLSRPMLWTLPLWAAYWVVYTYFEERFELIPAYGERYLRYRDSTGRLLPRPEMLAQLGIALARVAARRLQVRPAPVCRDEPMRNR